MKFYVLRLVDWLPNAVIYYFFFKFFLQTFIYRVIQFGIRGPISFLF
jgi:hypothetical protein